MSANLSPGGYVRHGQRSTSPPQSVNVQVAVRCRPLNDRERAHGERAVLSCDEGRREVQFCAPGALRKNGGTSHSAANPSGKKTFTYDQVYGPDATQGDVYEGLVEPIVDEVLQGYNCTVFAYGQTGTGKTHTMEGQRDDDMIGVEERRLASNAGIIPRAVKQVFDHLRSLTDEHSVRVSHLELYNEQLTDLLGPAELASESLRVYEDSQKGTFVQGLEDVVVRSEDEIFAVLDRSATKRKTAETLMNKFSSRSHSIFSITIHIKESTPEGADLLKVGKLNLVDLAGSENVGRSGAVKGRAREAGNINQSLLTLGRVITALVDRHPHVPYRDSKLTRLLQESLGGRNKTCVIATITPASCSFEETASTLDYAYRAKSIKNRPTVNQMIAKHVLLKEYTEEMAKLRRELDATRAKNGVYLPPDEFEKLKVLGSQQRDTISYLTEQSEDYERRLAAQKEKLERTQEALARDQRSLAETRQSLAAVESELEDTTHKLQVTAQQREENASLVKNHVESEKLLYDQGVTLQKNFAACLSDSESLHTRVSVKDDLEKRNLANLNSLKETVSGGISTFYEILRKHKLEQQSLVQTSTSSLEELAKALDSGLESMMLTVGDFSSGLQARHEAGAAKECEMIKTFENSCAENFDNVKKDVDLHSQTVRGEKESIVDACNGISACFHDSKRAVSSMRTLLKEFETTQKDRFGALAEEQEKVLQDLHRQVSECLEQQAALFYEFRDLNEKDSEREVNDLQKMKSDIIENITSSLDTLVEDTLSRVTRRKEQVASCAEGISSSAAAVDETMRNMQTVNASKFQEVRQGIDSQITTLEEDLSARSDGHGKLAEQGETLLGALQHNVTEISTSFENTSHRTKDILGKTRTLIQALRSEREDERNGEHKDYEGRIAKMHESLSNASQSLNKSAKTNQDEVTSSLTTIEQMTGASQTNMESALTSVHGSINEHQILCDEDHDSAPERRAWPPLENLQRTRAHIKIISEMRDSRGLGQVPIEDFGHLPLNGDESSPPTDDDKLQEENDSADENEMVAQEGNAATDEASSSQGMKSSGSIEKLEESLTPQNPIATFSPETSQSEDTSVPILGDTTNRRPRNRQRKKLEHVIRKKPSALPVPRTRSGARRHGT